jgi:exonuclease SbcD
LFYREILKESKGTRMKLLHTSDWHLGRNLYQRRRYDEFAAFLDWIADKIETGNPDILLVAGDIFDTTAPSNRAQELYYSFLRKVSTSCRHIVITGGNHDSPSFLNAPKTILKALNVHVIGSMDPEHELLVFKDAAGDPEAIICAVPYLRDRDLRQAEAGESIDDKRIKLAEGFREHYREMADRAEKMRGDLNIPIVGTGHCFAAGGKITDDDGVRDLNVGSLGHVEACVFPDCFDYLALGHLHVPQKVAQSEIIRYSGSPIPMGFGEADQQKIILEIDFEGRTPTITKIPVPCFQPLKRITGSAAEILATLKQLKLEASNAWLEIEYTGEDIVTDLRDQIQAAIDGTDLEIRRIKNQRIMNRVLQQIETAETLDDLEPADVFQRCLQTHEIPESRHPELVAAYGEILQTLQEDDSNAD